MSRPGLISCICERAEQKQAEELPTEATCVYVYVCNPHRWREMHIISASSP